MSKKVKRMNRTVWQKVKRNLNSNKDNFYLNVDESKAQLIKTFIGTLISVTLDGSYTGTNIQHLDVVLDKYAKELGFTLELGENPFRNEKKD